MRAWASPEKAWHVPIMAAMRSTMSTRIGEAKCRAFAVMCCALLCSALLRATSRCQCSNQIAQRSSVFLGVGPRKEKAFPAESGAPLASSTQPGPRCFLHLHHTPHTRPPGLCKIKQQPFNLSLGPAHCTHAHSLGALCHPCPIADHLPASKRSTDCD
jgi:hypothetical protein